MFWRSLCLHDADTLTKGCKICFLNTQKFVCRRHREPNSTCIQSTRMRRAHISARLLLCSGGVSKRLQPSLPCVNVRQCECESHVRTCAWSTHWLQRQRPMKMLEHRQRGKNMKRSWENEKKTAPPRARCLLNCIAGLEDVRECLPACQPASDGRLTGLC